MLENAPKVHLIGKILLHISLFSFRMLPGIDSIKRVYSSSFLGKTLYLLPENYFHPALDTKEMKRVYLPQINEICPYIALARKNISSDIQKSDTEQCITGSLDKLKISDLVEDILHPLKDSKMRILF